MTESQLPKEIKAALKKLRSEAAVFEEVNIDEWHGNVQVLAHGSWNGIGIKLNIGYWPSQWSDASLVVRVTHRDNDAELFILRKACIVGSLAERADTCESKWLDFLDGGK